MSDKDPNDPGSRRRLQRIPAYFFSILLVFVLPALTLGKWLWKKISPKPFFLSIALISVIGWIWSWVVSSNQWWSFGERYMLGFEIIPYLPLEEFLFYPFGGALSILIYVSLENRHSLIKPGLYWGYLILGTLIFTGLAWFTRGNGPHYLTSQLIVYNIACCLVLAPFVAKRINLYGAILPALCLGTLGYFWDYIAFTYGWWDYHAITQIRISIVPIDDFNFFLYAPPSAISIYLVVFRFFNRDSPPPNRR